MGIFSHVTREGRTDLSLVYVAGLALVAVVAFIAARSEQTLVLAIFAVGAALSGLLLLRRPAIFLSVAMAGYGSTQFLLQERFRVSLGPVSLNASKAMIMGLAVALGLRLLLTLAARSRSHAPPASIVAGFLLAGWATVAALYSDLESDVFATTAKLFACAIAMLFAFQFTRSRSDFVWLFRGAGVAAIVASLVAFFDLLRGRGAMELVSVGAHRTDGGFSGAVATGTVAFFGLALAVAAMSSSTLGRRDRILALATIVCCSFGILATFARTAILGVLIFALLNAVWIRQGSARGGQWRRIAVLGCVVLAFVVGLSFISSKTISARIADIPGLGESGTGFSAEAGSGRGMIWAALLRHQIRSSPGEWLLGHGLLAVPDYVRRDLGLPFDGHNSYLNALFDMGLVGLLFYLAFVVLLLRELRKASMVGPIWLRSIAAIWLVYYVSFFLSTQMFNGYIYSIGPRWYSMIVAGAVLGLAARYNQLQESMSPDANLPS